jgi:hypothetical protein
LLDGVTYAYKSGEPLNTRAQAFDLGEATVARACQEANETLAVQAKREIGLLWDDIERAPYKTLFNAGVTGPDLWRAVEVVRSVEAVLQAHRGYEDGRRRLLAVHGNRLIAHLVFATMDTGVELPAHVESVYETLFNVVEELFPDAYLASLFKNLTKCQQLKARFLGQG